MIGSIFYSISIYEIILHFCASSTVQFILFIVCVCAVGHSMVCSIFGPIHTNKSICTTWTTTPSALSRCAWPSITRQLSSSPVSLYRQSTLYDQLAVYEAASKEDIAGGVNSSANAFTEWKSAGNYIIPFVDAETNLADTVICGNQMSTQRL